jgi:hypothetical protein
MYDDLDPMDFYDEFNDWLMNESGLMIGNGHMLTEAFEKEANFQDFIREKHPELL